MNKPDSLDKYLQAYFKYDTFKLGQREIITDVLANKDVLGVLPTGSGKSLCYQLPALMREGTTLVVTPLISLMIDQVRQLKIKGIRRVIALNSFTSWQERREIYANLRHYKIIYVSPELMQQESLLNSLKNLHINLFVIDEAHCISQWGHEFRTDYLRLRTVLSQLNNPPILALTATATEQVQDDILNVLQRKAARKHIYSVDRPNLIYSLLPVKNHRDKLTSLVNILKEFRVPSLVYFTSRKMSERVAKEIKKHLPQLRTSFYHGGMDSLDRLTIQQQFMNDQIDVICCTSAFGMGINKQNIRLIIHYHFPTDLESYSQEIGRAGRDGLSSLGVVLYNKTDLSLQTKLINYRFPDKASLEEIRDALIKHKGRSYPELKPLILKIVNNNEVHLQFLHYHLEKHGIIDHNQIINCEQKIIAGLKDISFHMNKRYKLKTNKLSDMIQWLESSSCLRAGLNNYFNSNYEVLDQCCSNCGFRLKDWEPKETESAPERIELDWKEKLSKILRTEEKYELK